MSPPVRAKLLRSNPSGQSAGLTKTPAHSHPISLTTTTTTTTITAAPIVFERFGYDIDLAVASILCSISMPVDQTIN